jgi:hypothetical protein
MDRSKRIDIEVKKIHTDIKKANLILREKLKDVQDELLTWDLLDGRNDESGEDYLHQK